MTQLVQSTNAQRLFSQAPELKTILDTDICPQTAAYAQAVFDTTKQSVKFLNDALEGYISDLPNSTVLTSEVKTNRYAHALLQTYYTSQSLERAIDNYCSSHTSISSYMLGLATNMAQAPLNLVLHLIYSYAPPIACDKPLSTQDRTEYTYCKGFASFVAEKTLQEMVPGAGTRCVGSSPILTKYLENFGSFWAAANNQQISLSFNVKETQDIWDAQIRDIFCKTAPEHSDCQTLESSTSTVSFDEWKKHYSGSIHRLPSVLRTEIQNQDSTSDSIKTEL